MVVGGDGGHQTSGVAFVMPDMMVIFGSPKVDIRILGVLNPVWGVLVERYIEELEVVFLAGELSAPMQDVGLWGMEIANDEGNSDEKKKERKNEK